MTALRARLYRHLNPGAWSRRGLSPANRLIIAAILLSVISAVLQTEPAVMAYSAAAGILAAALSDAFTAHRNR